MTPPLVPIYSLFLLFVGGGLRFIGEGGAPRALELIGIARAWSGGGWSVAW